MRTITCPNGVTTLVVANDAIWGGLESEVFDQCRNVARLPALDQRRASAAGGVNDDPLAATPIPPASPAIR